MEKRKDLITNIRSRLNSGAYNSSRYSKNEKDLLNKVKFFQKKEADGTLKEYMRERYQEAKDLLVKLQSTKSGLPMAANDLSLPPVVFAPRAKTAKKRPNVPVNLSRNLGAPNFNHGLRIKIPGKTIRARTIKKILSPAAGYEADGIEDGLRIEIPKRYKASGNTPYMARLQKPRGRTAKAVNTNPLTLSNIPELPPMAKARTVKKARMNNNHLRRAINEGPPIPELHDPYTGRKFDKEENPFPPIEKAYKELRELRKIVFNKAKTYRNAAI